MLLARGYTLDRRAIQRLQELGLSEVWLDYPGLESIGHYINPQVFQARASLSKRVNSMLQAFEHDRHAKVGMAQYRAALQELIDALTNDPVAAVYLDDLHLHDNPLLRHSSNTCFLSLLLGLKLQGYLVQQRPRLSAEDAGRVLSLGLGAILHDIGMRELHEAVRERWEATRCEHDPAWREHCQLGYRLVTGRVDPPAAAVVLHHHQYFDGSGFPTRMNEAEGRAEGMAGTRIHVFARIVALADHFDELQHIDPEGPRVPTVRVMRQLLEPAMLRRFDPEVLRALFSVVPAYAPGSLVTLSNGRRGFVMDWKRNLPCRPRIAFVPRFSGDDAGTDAPDVIADPRAMKHVRAAGTRAESDPDERSVACATAVARENSGASPRMKGRARTGAKPTAASAAEAPHPTPTASVDSLDLMQHPEMYVAEIDGIDVSDDEFRLPKGLCV
ncbi:MAG: HD-GYP domain-containing protein [Planctomycetota bacterium]